MYSVLFVCTANICRSPMAMGLLRFMVSEQKEDWCIQSAGTWAVDGEPAAVKTQQVLIEKGIDISQHRSHQVSEEMLKSFQLILTMEQGHKEALRIEFPETASRVFLLSEMIDQVFDIRDPIRGPLIGFRETLRDIDYILSTGFEKISTLAKENVG